MNEVTWLCGATAIPIILLFIFSGFKIDVIMTLSSVAKLPEIKIESQDMYFARGKFKELQIDILLTKNPLLAQVEKITQQPNNSWTVKSAVLRLKA